MFDNGKDFYFAPDESISASNLKDQGVKTVKQEVKEEEKAEKARQEKEDSPIFYYVKKLALPGILITGAIIIASTIGRETIRGLFAKKSAPAPTPALEGPKQKRKRKSKK